MVSGVGHFCAKITISKGASGVFLRLIDPQVARICTFSSRYGSMMQGGHVKHQPLRMSGMTRARWAVYVWSNRSFSLESICISLFLSGGQKNSVFN